MLTCGDRRSDCRKPRIIPERMGAWAKNVITWLGYQLEGV
jgi:hypothetical protein